MGFNNRHRRTIGGKIYQDPAEYDDSMYHSNDVAFHVGNQLPFTRAPISNREYQELEYNRPYNNAAYFQEQLMRERFEAERQRAEEEHQLGMLPETPLKYRLAAAAFPAAAVGAGFAVHPALGAAITAPMIVDRNDSRELASSLSRTFYRNDMLGDKAKNWADDYLENYNPTR